MDDHLATVESVFRSESGRIIAGLIRISHSFDLAEEAMQDAFAAAVVSWRTEGIPTNPAAWITATARRKLIDYARREQTRRNHEGQLLYEYESRSTAIDEEMSRPFEDDRLSLIFTCCHPAPTYFVAWVATGKHARITTAGWLSPPMRSRSAICAAVSPS
jgi:RNA polymerase sigma-70 factor (ECF subfamily)